MTRLFARMPRLMAEPGALLLGLVTLASGLAVQYWSAVDWATRNPGMFGLISLAGVVVQLMAWWYCTRMLAGYAKGEGRVGKWLLYTFGYGMLIAVVGAILGFWSASTDNLDRGQWVAAAIMAMLSGALSLIIVRTIALSISGDRIRFSAIRDTLGPQFVYLALAMILLSLPPMIAPDLLYPLAQGDSDIVRFGVTSGTAVISALATMAQLALLVSAYLEVDRYVDEAAVRNTFG